MDISFFMDLSPLLIYKIIDSIVEIITFFLALYCFYIVNTQFHIKKSKTSSILRFIFLFLAFAPIAQFCDGLFYETLYYVKYGYAFIILLLALVNILLFMFATEVFFVKEKRIPRRFQIILILFASTEIALSIVGFIMKLQNMDVTIVIGLHMVVGMLLYIGLASRSFQLASKIEDNFYKQSIRYIGLFALTLLIIYIFFILDSFYSVYTIWGVFGWSFYLLSVYLAYRGFVKPIIAKLQSKNGSTLASSEHLNESNSLNSSADKTQSEALNEKQLKSLTLSYVVFMIFYMGMYEIVDTYTTSFYPAIVSYIIADFGISITQYYYALSIASIGLYFVILIQFFSDYLGRKPMIIFVFLGMGVSMLCLGLATSLTEFTIALFFMFIFFSSDLWVIMISEVAPKEKRGKYTYIVMLIGVIGVFIIPLFRSLITDPLVPRTWTNMTLIAWVFIPIAVLGFFLKESPAFHTIQHRQTFKERWNWTRIIQNLKTPFISADKRKILSFIIIGFVLGINYTTFQTVEKFLTLYISDNDLISLLILVAGIGSLLVFGFTGILADKFGRKVMMVVYSLVLIGSIIGLVFSTMNLIIAGVFIFIITSQIGFWGCFTLSKLYCVECFSTEIRGYSIGWRSFAYALGLTIGALMSAGLTMIVSLGISYIINALWIAIFVPLFVWKFLPETKGLEINSISN